MLYCHTVYGYYDETSALHTAKYNHCSNKFIFFADSKAIDFHSEGDSTDDRSSGKTLIPSLFSPYLLRCVMIEVPP